MYANESRQRDSSDDADNQFELSLKKVTKNSGKLNVPG